MKKKKEDQIMCVCVLMIDFSLENELLFDDFETVY